MILKVDFMEKIIEYVKSLDVKTKQVRPINKYTQIKNMLTDIRYTGQIIRGKTYTKIEGLEKTRAINDGNRPLYVIKNHHPEIIDLATFDKVQEILSQSKQSYIKRPSRTIDLKNFIFSLNHEAYLHRKQIDVDNSDYDLLENEYQRKSDSPRLYMETAKHVLKRAMNSLGRNFCDLEAKYDKQVKLLLKEYDLELELITLANLVAGYKQEYYKIKDKKILDSSDTALMFQLEDVITKFSVEYVQLEDKYFENREMYKYPEMIKKLISSYDYPIQETDPDMVKSIFSNLVIVDSENYVFIINATNKKLTMDDIKKATTMKPLLESRCISKISKTKFINWMIVVI